MGRRPREDFPHRDASRKLADQLLELRRQRSWSQQHLAERAGLSYQAVRSLERNETVNPGIFTLKSLTDALGVRLEDLLAQITAKD